jgi:hypothetical protein
MPLLSPPLLNRAGVGGGGAEAHALGEAGGQRQAVGLVVGESDGDAGVSLQCEQYLRDEFARRRAAEKDCAPIVRR